MGYLYTEITLNNAVVRVFLKILHDSVNKKRLPSSPTRVEAHVQFNHHKCGGKNKSGRVSASSDDDGGWSINNCRYDYMALYKSTISFVLFSRHNYLVFFRTEKTPLLNGSVLMDTGGEDFTVSCKYHNLIMHA